MNTCEVKPINQQLFIDFFNEHPKGAALYDKNGILQKVNVVLQRKWALFDKHGLKFSSLFKSEVFTSEEKDKLRAGETLCFIQPARFSIISSRDSDGNISGYIFFCQSQDTEACSSISREEKIKQLKDINEKVAKAVPDTILLINRELVVERVIAYARETCITPAVVNCRIDELPGFTYPEATRKLMATQVTRCMQNSEPLTVEFSLPGHTGEIVYFQLRLVPMHQSYVVAYIRNITNQVNAQHELEQSKSLMEMALSNSNIATYIFNYNLYKACDKRTCNHCFQFYGMDNKLLRQNSYICKSLEKLRHTEDTQSFFYLFDKIRNDRLSKFTVDFRLKDNNGVYRSYEVMGKAQEKDTEGMPTVVVGCIIDNQHRIEYENTLIEAKEKAEKADRLKTQFLANMSHEIRTPLNAIVGFSELISEEEDMEVRKEYSNIIKTNNELLLRLINDVLDISKIESDMITFTLSEIELPMVMEEVYSTICLRVPASVKLVLDSCKFVIIRTDKNRFMQILINLLNNAIKYTEQGTIRFGYTIEEKFVKFHISDTGKGIPVEAQERIFNRFVQLNDSSQGIGLGLAICKGLLLKLGGNISVTSEVGKGSTFTFTLPIAYKGVKN